MLEVNFPRMSSTNEPLTEVEGNVHPITGNESSLLNSVVNIQVQEQLHLRFDKIRAFLI